MFVTETADVTLASARAAFDARMGEQMDAEADLRHMRVRFASGTCALSALEAAELVLDRAVDATQAARAAVLAAESMLDAAFTDCAGTLVDAGDDVSFTFEGRMLYGSVIERRWERGVPVVLVSEPGNGGAEGCLPACSVYVLDQP